MYLEIFQDLENHLIEHYTKRLFTGQNGIEDANVSSQKNNEV